MCFFVVLLYNTKIQKNYKILSKNTDMFINDKITEEVA